MAPRLRTLLLAAVVGTGAAALVGAMVWLGSREKLASEESAVMPVPRVKPSVPGDKLPPHVAEVWQKAEADWLKQAETQEGAAVPTLTELNPVAPKAPLKALIPPPPANPAPAADAQERQIAERRASDKAKALGSLLASWKPHTHTSQEAQIKIGEKIKEDQDQIAAAADTRVASYAAGPETVHYAMILTEVNSDEPGPVLADIVSGPLRGAKLLGRFNRREDRIVLEFDRMTLHQRTTSIHALAVDPDTYRQGIATHVNKRTFSRWAALLGSALLSGLQRGLLAQGTVVGLGDGIVAIDRDFDGKELAGIVAGEVGPRTRNAAEQYFNRPPTVTVAAGTGVGILFLEPVAIPLASAPAAVAVSR